MTVFLETKRLLLLAPELAHFTDLVALRSDREVMKYIGKSGAIQTAIEVQKFLNVAIEYYNKHGFSFCSVFEKDSHAFVGQAGLFHLGFHDLQPEIEVAFRLHQHYWGKGFATELACAIIAWGFQHLAVSRLVALIHPENSRSKKVLEKAGMMYSGKVTYYDQEVSCYEIYKNDSIDLVPYDTRWPNLAAEEMLQLREILPPEQVIDLQHVGSTAIPKIAAKPIIDIQIAVHSLPSIKPIAIAALETMGYQYWYENPDPDRLFFVKGMPPFGEKRTHHVHIVEPSSPHWHGKIQFRDYLLANPIVARDYESLKKKLAQQYTYDRERYTAAKSQFIAEILQKANRQK